MKMRLNQSKQKKRRRQWLLVGFLGVLIVVLILLVLSLRPGPKNSRHASSENQKSTVKLKPSNKFRDNGNQPTYVQGPVVNQLDQELKRKGFKGTALVIKDGHILLNRAYGKSNQSGKQNTVTTTYPLASISKNITGVLLVKVLHDHGYNFETKVSEFYPNLPHAKSVTIKDLVDMTSGYMVNGFSTKNLSEAGYINNVVQRAQYNPQYGENGKWRYSAANYIIVSGILRKLTHKSYDDLLDEYIQPYYHIENNVQFLSNKNRPVAYETDGKHPVKAPKAAFYSEVGTGNSYATPYTYYKLFDDEINGKLISKAQFTALTHPVTGKTYAGGVYTLPSINAYGGHGTQAGFESSYRISSDGKTGLFLFSNQKAEPENEEITFRYFNDLIKP
ncbi:beta-lactamase family protein [Weissella viridescens]|uniref:serine hydrolase domain-containing protein n=1 Tax=Weissella viridescens TaxID=1629 RepID=UPI001D064007|nr:serine hydrolase domain-containing protein [Weissella viridescens]MCB6839470.1 beta-lactamase family protein [Weissella viridescens]MCB6846201.1 beta-lactamase family protein [Weissella viridescens]